MAEKKQTRSERARELLKSGLSVEETVKKMRKEGDTEFDYQPGYTVKRVYREEFDKSSKKSSKPAKAAKPAKAEKPAKAVKPAKSEKPAEIEEEKETSKPISKPAVKKSDKPLPPKKAEADIDDF